MEMCWEYLGCAEKDCIMYGRKKGLYCWEIEGTLCNHLGIEVVRKSLVGKEKKEACAHSSCIYFKEAVQRNLVI